MLHRTHFDVFGVEISLSVFINQDADPFLFQLYRLSNVSVIAEDVVLANEIGGSGDARYSKQHVP
jgi:hypothetical protein